VILPPQPAPGGWPPAHELMADFEGLGENCEFGLAQRALGAEPIGLIRFGSASVAGLTAALDSGFAGLDDPSRIEIYVGNVGEFMVRLHPFAIRYHTFRRPSEVSADALHALEVRRVGLLRRKLLADIATGDRIFVRKDVEAWRPEAARDLLAALRRHGAPTLLWASPADGTRPPGTVEVVAPGLLRGHMGRLAPRTDPIALPAAEWLRVCRGAWRLVRDAAPVGATILAPATDAAEANLVPEAHSAAAAVWGRDDGLTSSRVPPPLVPSADVAQHVLGPLSAAAGWAVGTRPVRTGLEPGAIHVASAHVWIPAGFRGRVVGLVLAGLRSIWLDNARLDLRDQWQRAWVTARIPEGTTVAAPGLYVQGQPGDFVYSTCWRLEPGVLPAGVDGDL
jgi:hypothetical protein